ncbi:MAG: alpha-D-ribose 1-methylphosphonate 5-triphosphate synthase subunit PhnI [Motiliproteus sp.]|jgi:alpha-D-ribose 1-methylphosphonate 5-triphosphate synthase subunit PhnI
MYVAVKGGEQAITRAHQLLAKRRRGDTAIAALSVPQRCSRADARLYSKNPQVEVL